MVADEMEKRPFARELPGALDGVTVAERCRLGDKCEPRGGVGCSRAEGGLFARPHDDGRLVGPGLLYDDLQGRLGDAVAIDEPLAGRWSRGAGGCPSWPAAVIIECSMCMNRPSAHSLAGESLAGMRSIACVFPALCGSLAVQVRQSAEACRKGHRACRNRKESAPGKGGILNRLMACEKVPVGASQSVNFMCGICGVIGGDRRQVEPAVRRMMRAMVHRGPDDEGYEELPLGDPKTGAVAGFGFRRLAILDLSAAGHQPMFNERTGDCLIFNGEIYNFTALRAELQVEGVRFRGTSDTEVLLHALSRWGEAALEKLDGMFALAFYEAAGRRILLARDPLGIKPLYFADLPGQVAFASEVRALLASGVVPDDLDIAGIAGMLAYGAPQDPLTVHKAIRSLPAGEKVWVDADARGTGWLQAVRPFWDFAAALPASVAPRLPQAGVEVRRLLETAVQSHLVSDRPVGVFLSAGIDSFTIAAIAKRHQADIRTFTVGFADIPASDELAAASNAARSLGTRHEEIRLDSETVRPLWDSWLAAADRPSIDGLNTFVVSYAVKQTGKCVALSGLGGDELFGGYPNFTAAARYHRLLRAVEIVPRPLRSWAMSLATFFRRASYRERAVELFTDKSDIASIAFRLRRILSDQQMASLGLAAPRLGLNRLFLAAPPRADGAAAGGAARSFGDDAFRQVMELECRYYMGNTLLRDTDTTSMAHSLEVRVPFLDRRVVDYVSALPSSAKAVAGGPSKLLLREACRDLLPADLVGRPKTGFTLPVDKWMHGPLRDSCEAAIASLVERDILEPMAVRAIWQDFTSSSAHAHWIRPMTLVALGNYLARVRGRGGSADQLPSPAGARLR